MNARRGMGFAALVTMASVLLSRVLGLLRESLLASRLGTGLDADAYAVAFMLPDLLNTLLAGGFLSISFLPLFTQAESEDRAASERFLGGVQLLLGGMGLVGIGLLWIFAEQAVGALQPALVGTVVLQRAVHLSRILLPAQIAFLLAGAWNGAQYARKRFLYPALAPLVYNGGILVGGYFLAPWMGAEGFAWGVLGGALVGNLALQGVGAWQAGVRMRLPLAVDLPRLKAFGWRTLPLMVGLTLGFSSEFLLRRMNGSLGTGAVAEANYAFRLTMVLVALFGQASGVASYPYLVELANTGRVREFNELLTGSLARLLAYLLPACTIAVALAPELVCLAFQRGHFSAQATGIVTTLFRIQVMCVLPWCVQIVFARACYARGRFWSTAALGTVLVAVCWPLWSLLTDLEGKSGASLGLVLLVGLEAVGFLAFWMRLFPGEFSPRDLLGKAWRSVVLSLLAGALALACHRLPLPALLRLGAGCALGGGFYLSAGLRLGLEELAPVRQKLSRLLRRIL
jgi:putative peptidoglycan lipid II flippase